MVIVLEMRDLRAINYIINSRRSEHVGSYCEGAQDTCRIHDDATTVSDVGKRRGEVTKTKTLTYLIRMYTVAAAVWSTDPACKASLLVTDVVAHLQVALISCKTHAAAILLHVEL